MSKSSVWTEPRSRSTLVSCATTRPARASPSKPAAFSPEGVCCCERQARGDLAPLAGQIAILRIKLDADATAAQLQGNQPSGAAAEEWIEHQAARWAAGEDARLDEIRRERGKVGVRVSAGCHRPHVALVPYQFKVRLIPMTTSCNGSRIIKAPAVRVRASPAECLRISPQTRIGDNASFDAAWILNASSRVILRSVSVVALLHLHQHRSADRLLDRLRVVKVTLILSQQKQVLVRFCWTVRDALGHRVWLVPDDVAAQIPAVRLKGERHTPGHANKILRLQRRRRFVRSVLPWHPIPPEGASMADPMPGRRLALIL